MTSDPRVAEAERAFLEAVELACEARVLATRVAQSDARSSVLSAALASARIAVDAEDAAYRALQAARAGKEAGR